MNRKLLSLLALGLLLAPSLAAADNCRGRHFGNGGYGNNSHYAPGYVPGGYRPNPWVGQQYYQPRPAGFGANANALIHQGIRDGRLSPREQQELWSDQQRINWERARFSSDGRIDPWERQQLRDSRREFYQDLNHELNDGERGYGRGRWGW